MKEIGSMSALFLDIILMQDQEREARIRVTPVQTEWVCENVYVLGVKKQVKDNFEISRSKKKYINRTGAGSPERNSVLYLRNLQERKIRSVLC